MLNIETGSILEGRYKILKQIGAGGMGAVYLACDTNHPDFQVALKVLYPGVIKTHEARERFRNEIVASYRVNHPNIIRAYEFFDLEDFQAYTMEYADGGDLFGLLRNAPLSSREVINLIKQAAMGLAAVHAEGIVHRDLKPENIMLTRKHVVKISDFGVARLKDSATLTQAGAMVGTPKYLSPEYIETGECDRRGDIYALGVIAYELISGTSPFPEDQGLSLMLERFKAGFKPLRQAAPHCPPGLVSVIEKAMSLNVNRRYQTADALVKDLELIEKGKEPLSSGSEAHPSAWRDMVASVLDPAEAGLPGANIFVRKPILRKVLRTALNYWQIILAMAAVLLIAAAAMLAGMHESDRQKTYDISELPYGSYKGTVIGLLADNAQYPFALWKTDAGGFILLGKQFCATANIGPDNTFNCGDLHFKLTVNAIEGERALGTMQETSWGSTGTWNLSKREQQQ